MLPDDPRPFTTIEYAMYIEAVVTAIVELSHQDHTPASFLGSIHDHLAYRFDMGQALSGRIGDTEEAISQARIEQFHLAVTQQVFRRLS